MTYKCPVCGGDSNTYLRCYRSDCPDGHDQPGTFYPPEPKTAPSANSFFGFLIGLGFAVILVMGIVIGKMF